MKEFLAQLTFVCQCDGCAACKLNNCPCDLAALHYHGSRWPKRRPPPDVSGCCFFCVIVKTLVDIRASFSLLERAVTQFDARFTLRALRSISSLRKHLGPGIISLALALTYPLNDPTAQALARAVGEEDALASKHSEENGGGPSHKPSKKEIIPEIDVYIGILIQVGQTRRKRVIGQGETDFLCSLGLSL